MTEKGKEARKSGVERDPKQLGSALIRVKNLIKAAGSENRSLEVDIASEIDDMPLCTAQF